MAAYQGFVFSFCLLVFLKYSRLLVNTFAYLRIRPIPIPDKPTYGARDATVILPCLEGDGCHVRETLRSILSNDPHQIYLVTIDANLEKAIRLAESFSTKRIRVESIPQANKRHQMCRALPQVETEITVFADDDVIWPPTLLAHMLAPFEDGDMGGVGTNQRLRRKAKPNVWDFLGAAYLIRRNWDIAACTYIDGGLPCLSGRTVAYRTKILQSPTFLESFMNETWGTCILNADDDNFLTRWMVNHGWKTWIQFSKDCEVQTSLADNSLYISQCLRWVRSNWRSNLKSLFVDRAVWWRHPWSTFAVFQTTLTSWSFALDPLLAWLFWQISAPWSTDIKYMTRSCCYLWIFLLCRVVKYLGHFQRYPTDLRYVLLIPLFGYFHSSVIKLFGMVTLHVTTWGSRDGADAYDRNRLVHLPPYSPNADSSQPSQHKLRRSIDDFHDDSYETQPMLPRYVDPV